MAWVESRKLAKTIAYYVVYEPAKGVKHKITGFTNKRSAEGFRNNLDLLASARTIGGDLSPALMEWVNGLSDDVHAKLASDGYLEPRVIVGTLKDLTDHFLNGEEAQSKKDSTLRSRQTMVKRWHAFFGSRRNVADFTTNDAKRYAAYHADKYAPATWGREIRSLKSIFQYAVEDLDWIKKNPFRKLKGASQANKDDLHEVTLEETKLIFDECPTAEMRLILCLARFGGLRVSELAVLEWDGVNYDRNTLTVNVPKKTHKKEQEKGEFETRVIPLWPEIRQAFEEYWETLPDGASNLVFPNCPTGQALTSRFRKILKRAGVPMWGNFFKSMRATRDTELRRRFPEYQVNHWIGHTQDVAERHYILNTVESMQEASRFTTFGTVGETVGVTVGVTVGAQSRFQNCLENQESKKSPQITALNEGTKKGVTSLQRQILTSMGLEPMPRP